MMIHEKLMSGQFLLDLKSDRSSLLHAAAVHHSAHSAMQNQPPTPPMDIYAAYAYQQQLQQNISPYQQQRSPIYQRAPPAEVLDLSRRLVETPPRKTPSPYQTNSSFGTVSPAASPTGCPQEMPQQRQQSPHTRLSSMGSNVIPANLLYSTKVEQPTQGMPTLPPALASLYPSFYYSANIKQESIPTTTAPQRQLPPAPLPPMAQASKQLSPVAATSLLQTFATAAAAAVAINNDTVTTVTPPAQSPPQNSAVSSALVPFATTPTSSNSSASLSALAAIDSKTTRPFKAFPRDPLVIAANFAATDVLLDNPRVERYTEYRKRVLEQIRSSNGGSRTITNPKMRRTNSRSSSINDVCNSSNNNSESEDQRNATEESSDCDSNVGNFEKKCKTASNSNKNTNTNANANDGENSDNNNNNNNNNNNANSKSNDNNCPARDAAYYERRRKNNAAAKKSRDRRRIKEDEIAIRAAYLERQNIELLCQIDALKAQLAAFTSKVGA